MHNENRRPPSAKRNGRGKKLSSASSAITITAPALAPEAWELITVDLPTGLAMVGGLVQIAFPKDVGLWLCDATVIAPDRIRFHVANHGKSNLPAQEITIQFHPYVKHRSLLPEVKFEDLGEIL